MLPELLQDDTDVVADTELVKELVRAAHALAVCCHGNVCGIKRMYNQNQTLVFNTETLLSEKNPRQMHTVAKCFGIYSTIVVHCYGSFCVNLKCRVSAFYY